MCGCNKKASKRYEVVAKDGTVQGPFATHAEARAAKAEAPGSTIREKTLRSAK